MFLRAASAIAVCAVALTVAPGPRAHAATLQVPADYATIQQALDAAQDGDVVLVAPGTWAGPLSLAGKTVTLASHFVLQGDPALIAQTVIDGGGGSYAVFVDDSVGPATTVQGFTIRNADDGVRIDGSFRLLDCHVTGNGDGVQYKGGGGLVQRCVIEDNRDDGIDLDDDVSLVIEDNDIVDNGGSPSLDGDGIEIRLQNYQGPTIQVVIRNNRIDRNTSDGVQLISYDVTTQRVIRIEGNSFVANRLAALGMMCCTDSEEDFQGAALGERVLVAGNSFVGNGHGITGGDDVVVLNNLFVSTTQLALKRLRGSSIAAHNLFWQNGGNWSDAIVDVGSSLLQDPLLAPDLTLLPGSPAIDAGTAFFQHLGEVVLDLPPSAYQGSAPDLGAFEEVGAPPNAAPFVDAGPDQVLPSGFSALLDGTALDDGQPTGSLVLAWSIVSGPGLVEFDDATASDPVASFSADGSYLLRLSADDSDLIAVDDVVIDVIDGAGIVEHQIGLGADDAEETLATGVVELAGAVLDLGLRAGSLQPQRVGLRWQALPIPPGSEIHQAYVQFEAALTAPGSAQLEIRGEPAGGAAPFSATTGNLTARPLTAASVPWSAGAWVSGQAGLAQRTPDLSAIVQEVVDGVAWDQGDALALHFTGSGSRPATSFEADPFAAPLLHLVFAPPVENQAPLLNAGPDAIVLLGDSGHLSGEVVDDDLPEGQPLGFLWSVESGPPGASINAPTDLATQAHFSVPGVYLLRLTADDSELSSFDELVITVIQNQPPLVDVGPDRSVLLPAAASLSASVGDDGLPGPLALLWTAQSGPGSVSFSAPTSASTQAQFSAPGVYRLRLAADDGDLSSFDELLVSALQNQAPSVAAGPDQTLLLPAAAELAADLAASVSDDGLPTGQLFLQWSAQSGPGSVSFQPAHTPASRALFSTPGSYVLRFTAFDGALGGFDELTVHVVQNQPPLVDAGPDRSILISESASLAGSASDDGLLAGELELSWTLESGPGSASFSTTTEAVSEASFSAPGIYLLRLAAADGELGSTDELRVAVAIEDPGLFDRQVGAPDDDAEEDLRNGNINRDSTVLDIGRYTGSPARDQIVGLRFLDVVIPGGASVLSATLQLESAGANTGLAALSVRAQDGDDAEPFTDATDNLSSRPTTSASVSWSPPDWTAAGVAGPGQAVDVSGPLQEVLDRPGWSAGNALALLLSGTGTRRARSYNGSPAGAARLHVEYQAAACADGLDNDADGASDFPEDLGCASAASSRENPACSDGLDNDADGAIDSPGADFCADPWQDAEYDDSDSDGVLDPFDNCSELANPAQIDSNGDGFGNACDPDYNGDGMVGLPDLALLVGKLGLGCGAPGWDPDLDLNGDCLLGLPDFATLAGFLGSPPGPSGLVPGPAGLDPAPAGGGGVLEPASATVSPPPDAAEPEPQRGRAGAPRRARRSR